MDVFPIRFGTESHYMDALAFNQAIAGAAKVVDSIARDMLGSDARFEVVVYATESGSILERIGIALGAAGGIVAILDSPTIGAFTEGAFGAKPAEYARELGEWVLEWREADRDEWEVMNKLTDVEDEEKVEKAINYVSQIILDCPPEKLESIARDSTIPLHTLQGYSSFYEGCLADSRVQDVLLPGIGSRPIPRGDFAARSSV